MKEIKEMFFRLETNENNYNNYFIEINWKKTF